VAACGGVEEAEMDGKLDKEWRPHGRHGKPAPSHLRPNEPPEVRPMRRAGARVEEHGVKAGDEGQKHRGVWRRHRRGKFGP
jgi:hypothetical protein